MRRRVGEEGRDEERREDGMRKRGQGEENGARKRRQGEEEMKGREGGAE